MQPFLSRGVVRAALVLFVLASCSAPHSGKHEEGTASVSEAVSFQGIGSPSSVTPGVQCVTQSGGHPIAIFKANNATSSTVVVPVGVTNKLSAVPLGGGQPTSFAPGAQYFSVGFSAGTSMTWTLGTRTATATTSSSACTVSSSPIGPVVQISGVSVPVRLDPATVLANTVVPTETDAALGQKAGEFIGNLLGGFLGTSPQVAVDNKSSAGQSGSAAPSAR